MVKITNNVFSIGSHHTNETTFIGEIHAVLTALSIFVISQTRITKNQNLKSRFMVQMELNKKREVHFVKFNNKNRSFARPETL